MAAAWAAALGCGHGAPAPAIQSFFASRSSVAAGGAAQLTATFSGGSGAVDNGAGPVKSGVPVTVSPTATTTYALTVTGGLQASTHR